MAHHGGGPDDPIDGGSPERDTAAEVTGSDPGSRDTEARAALRAGDRRTALAHCVREHGLALGRYCMAMLGSRSEADDVVRAALLAVCSQPAELGPEDSLRAHLLAVARRDCARRLERRRTTGPLRLVTADEQRSDAADSVLGRARAARADLAALRPSEREALVARFVAQLSYAEVAAAWGIEEQEARDRVSRALVALSARTGIAS
jgi:RNA polymerase sigma-70 factor, ECF subfamily